MLKKRADWACIVTATVCTLISYDWPHKTGLLFSSFIAIGVGFYIEQVCNKNELNGDEK